MREGADGTHKTARMVGKPGSRQLPLACGCEINQREAVVAVLVKGMAVEHGIDLHHPSPRHKCFDTQGTTLRPRSTFTGIKAGGALPGKAAPAKARSCQASGEAR